MFRRQGQASAVSGHRTDCRQARSVNPLRQRHLPRKSCIVAFKDSRRIAESNSTVLVPQITNFELLGLDRANSSVEDIKSAYEARVNSQTQVIRQQTRRTVRGGQTVACTGLTLLFGPLESLCVPTCAYSLACPCTCTRMRARAHTHTHARAFTHTCTHTQARAFSLTRAHAHTHTHTNTRHTRHKRTHTNTNTNREACKQKHIRSIKSSPYIAAPPLPRPPTQQTHSSHAPCCSRALWSACLIRSARELSRS